MMNDLKRKIAQKFLNQLLAEKDPEIYKTLALVAHEIARTMHMKWLDNRRVRHCLHCAGTDQLLAAGGQYFCTNHFPKPALAVVNGHA